MRYFQRTEKIITLSIIINAERQRKEPLSGRDYTITQLHTNCINACSLCNTLSVKKKSVQSGDN